jgi:hypothetical protein
MSDRILRTDPIPQDIVDAAVKVSAYLKSIGGKDWVFMGICDRSFAEKEYELKTNITAVYQELIKKKEKAKRSAYGNQNSHMLFQFYYGQTDGYTKAVEELEETFDFLPKKT